MKKIILFSLFALLSTLFMQAQSDKSSPFSIKGQVIDSITNETVPYATLSISLSQSPQKAEKLLACDIDGKFEAEMKVPGTYIITMQSLGKVTSKTSFTLSEEKKKLDDLLEEGRKISYLYEMQAREIPGSEKFEGRADEFRSLSDISAQRTQLEQMIAQVVGKQSEYQPKEAQLWPKEARKVASAKSASQKKVGNQTKAAKQAKKSGKGKGRNSRRR